MEASTCAQVVSGHTASLLTSLNLQREQAQFCDCVIRRRQSPGQLYSAHRCILAASSPVLASILSSSGALVELQAPCLSGPVLALLLDYIYTGTLPYAHTQQYYSSLLTAACYLQMDELQEALGAWQQTEANDAGKINASTGAENQPCEDNISSHSDTANSCTKDHPSTCIIDASRNREGTDSCRARSSASSPKREGRQCLANVEAGDEAQRPSASIDSCNRAEEMDKHVTSSINGANCCSRKDVRTVSARHSSISEHCTESSVNTGNCRQVIYLTHQDLSQNIPRTVEACGVSEVDKEVQQDQFHSAGTVKPESWQKSTEEALRRTVEDRRNSSSSSSSSSPHPCGGAVPVIRHSSGGAVLQLAEVSTMAPYLPVSQASVSSSRAPVPQSASTEKDNIVEGITEHKNDQQMDNGLYHVTDHNGHHARCDSFQNKNHKKHGTDDSAPQNKVRSKFIRGLKYKTELGFGDLPSKRQQLDWSDRHNVSVSAAAEELSQGPRAVVPLPLEDSDKGTGSKCKDSCHEGETKEEHSYSSRCPSEMDRHDFHHYGPKTDLHLRGTFSRRRVHDNRDIAMEDERHCADDFLPISATPESSFDNVTAGLFAFERQTSLALEKISCTEITEPQATLAMSVDSDMSDPSAVGHSYSGHLQYHCLPQEDMEDMHLLHRDSDHKHSHPSYPDYLDQSSDEEEAGTFASAGHSSLRQHFARRTTDRILLLDLSTKPAELLVSYKHRPAEEEKGVTFRKNNTFVTEVRNKDRAQSNEITPLACVDERKMRSRKFADRQSNGKDQSSAEADVTHKAGGAEEVSNPKESESQGRSLTVCSPPPVPDSVQASVSSTLSVCIPSPLSANMPTNISAHLSTPLHHSFQCSLCDRSFSQRGSLNRHVRSHLGVRPFPCPCCPMTFSRQYRVTEHMRVHQRCSQGNDFQKPPASSI